MELIDQLISAFPLSKREAQDIIYTAPYRYKIHYIEKRNGRGQREIAQPTAELKTLQRWIVATHLSELPVHSAATAYRPGLSIKDHASLHASNTYLLKLDFLNFFPSILGRDFQTHLHLYTKLSSDDSRSLTRLLFRLERGKNDLILSIGAPSSPAVSNTVMYRFDTVITEYCSRKNITYSRYADDLAFSTNEPHILDEMLKFVKETCLLLDYPRLKINESKTVFTSKKRQRQLTGLILTNDGAVSMGRERKREIRAMAHRYATGNLPPDEIDRLRGLLAFATAIEPNYVAAIKRMIGNDVYHVLMHPAKP